MVKIENNPVVRDLIKCFDERAFDCTIKDMVDRSGMLPQYYIRYYVGPNMVEAYMRIDTQGRTAVINVYVTNKDSRDCYYVCKHAEVSFRNNGKDFDDDEYDFTNIIKFLEIIKKGIK